MYTIYRRTKSIHHRCYRKKCPDNAFDGTSRNIIIHFCHSNCDSGQQSDENHHDIAYVSPESIFMLLTATSGINIQTIICVIYYRCDCMVEWIRQTFYGAMCTVLGRYGTVTVLLNFINDLFPCVGHKTYGNYCMLRFVLEDNKWIFAKKEKWTWNVL